MAIGYHFIIYKYIQNYELTTEIKTKVRHLKKTYFRYFGAN